MSTPQHITVRVSRRIAASPERAFDAFLDPKKAGRFMFATLAGQMVRAEIDPRVGGAYTFVDRRNGDLRLLAGRDVDPEQVLSAAERVARVVEFTYGPPSLDELFLELVTR